MLAELRYGYIKAKDDFSALTVARILCRGCVFKRNGICEGMNSKIQRIANLNKEQISMTNEPKPGQVGISDIREQAPCLEKSTSV